jgi:hypothetical protein
LLLLLPLRQPGLEFVLVLLPTRQHQLLVVALQSQRACPGLCPTCQSALDLPQPMLLEMNCKVLLVPAARS